MPIGSVYSMIVLNKNIGITPVLNRIEVSYHKIQRYPF